VSSKKIFTVTISQDGVVACSCLRFYDELIPCQHILRVLASIVLPIPVQSLIGNIYSVGRFIQAFPNETPFFPEDSSSYESNPSVIPQKLDARSGASRSRRIPSSGELNPRRKPTSSSTQCENGSECSSETVKNCLDRLIVYGGILQSITDRDVVAALEQFMEEEDTDNRV